MFSVVLSTQQVLHVANDQHLHTSHTDGQNGELSYSLFLLALAAQSGYFRDPVNLKFLLLKSLSTDFLDYLYKLCHLGQVTKHYSRPQISCL